MADDSYSTLTTTERSPKSSNTPTRSAAANTLKSLTASRRNITLGAAVIPASTAPATKQSILSANITLPKFNHDKITGTKCSVCKRKFGTNTLLKKHYGIHDGYDKFVCLVCGAGFQKHSLIKSHKTKYHKSPSGAFKCEKCDAGFPNKFRRDKHAELCLCGKHEVSPTCFFCPQTFPNWMKLVGHMSVHLKRCTFCDARVDSMLARTKHMLECPKNPLIKSQRE